MANSYPTSLNNYATGASSETLVSAGHASEHNALETKLGTGASTPIANTVLRGTGTGTTAYGQVVLTTDVTGVLPGANGGTGKVTLTQPATGSTLTILDGKTLTIDNSLTLAGTDTTTMTFPSTSDTVVTLGATQTLTNKTLTSPNVGTALNDTNGNPIIVPTATASAVNGVGVVNGATGTGPTIKPDGASSDTNADLIIEGKGTGKVSIGAKYGSITSVSAQAFDGSKGNNFTRTLAASETFTQSNFTTGQVFLVKVKQGTSTSYTVTWWSGITWITSGATAPTQTTTSNGYTTYGFVCTGTNTFDGYLVSTQ